MVTLTRDDGEVIDLSGITGFQVKTPPGSKKFFHVYAKGIGRRTSIFKYEDLDRVILIRDDLVRYVIDIGTNVIEHEDTGRIVPA